jgi:hypothetical protein
MHNPSRAVLAFGLAVAAVSVPAARLADDEPAPRHKASALLPASVLKGPHYSVDEDVETEGYYHTFTLTSDYGPFTAVGRSVLTTRIDEVRAIAALHDVSKSEVFLKSAGGAVVDLGKGVAGVVTKPTETAKGIAGGIKRFGVNLGRASKRAVTTEGGADTGESAPEGAANTLLGVSSSMRQWARKVRADPYTTNLVLRDALKGIAQVDTAGSIATKVVVPIPSVVGTAATVGDLVWAKDPEELRKYNEGLATALGVRPDAAGRFFKNGWFTLTLQTRLIAALHAVNRPGCAAYLIAATHADDEREALFYVESAEMLHRLHAASPVSKLLEDSQAVVAAVGPKAILLAPVDDIRSTAGAREILKDVADRARNELSAASLELRTTGTISPRATADASAAGWAVAANLAR